jgi:hypothetical protein
VRPHAVLTSEGLAAPGARVTGNQKVDRSIIGRARVAVSGCIAVVLGLAPHVLHHAGPLAGAALLAGTGGSLLFGAIGLAAAIPMLVRVRRRCRNWRFPAALLVLMATMFSVSTFVVGPAISGGDDNDEPPARAPARPAGHEEHH